MASAGLTRAPPTPRIEHLFDLGGGMNNSAWTPALPSGFTRHLGEHRPSGRTRFPARTSGYVPPGWPREVHPPHAPDWETTASSFLLDCSPPEYRMYPVLRRHVIVLARFAARHVESQLEACRHGVGEVRASLGAYVSPDVLEAATLAWHEQVAVLTRRHREISLIEEALRGKVFVEKL